jgi:hypothetical protein
MSALSKRAAVLNWALAPDSVQLLMRVVIESDQVERVRVPPWQVYV